MEAIEVLLRNDETGALTGATLNRGLSRMSEYSARPQGRRITKGGLIATYTLFFLENLISIESWTGVEI